MTRLERHCRLVARAYPEGARAGEVLTTLMERNASRSVPRPGDAANVLWHGLAARLRTVAPGTRYGRWGDAVSVAVVLAMLVQAATAVAVATRVGEPPVPIDPSGMPGWDRRAVSFPLAGGGLLLLAAAAVACAACVTACLGRVGLARVLSAATAAAGSGAFAAERARGEHATFTSRPGLAVVVAAVVVVCAVLLTGAVARAARVVPRWWWATAAVACLAVAIAAVTWGPHPFGMGRTSVVLAAYVAQAVVLPLLALPLVRAAREVLGGAALVALPAAPLAGVLVAGGTYQWAPHHVLAGAAVGWTVLPLTAVLALRPD